jgi:hypothetical protein
MEAVEMSKYEYAIENTTKEQRTKYAQDGELSKLGGGQPSTFVLDLKDEYIAGKIEHSDMKFAVLKRYTKNEERH